jgi:NitT/TauT family transport system substrate-binding protein
MIKTRVASLLAVGLLLGTASLPALAADKVRVLIPVWSGFAPVVVARDKGYFKALDLDVDVKFEDDLPTAFAAMESGNIEVFLRTIGEYQQRPAAVKQGGIIIGEIDQSLGGDGTVADGAIKTAADLKGKILAETPTLPAMLLLQMDLKKVGLSLKDVTMKTADAGDAVATFSDPSVAAVATSEPYMSQAIKQNPGRNAHVLSTSKDYPGYIVDTIVARNDDLKQNPGKYARFLTGIYKAIRLYQSNPDDFIKTAAPRFQLAPADFKASITGTLDYVPFEEALKALGTPEAHGPVYKIFDTVMGLNLENGVATQTIKAEDAIDSSVITKITDKDLQ